VFVLSTLTRERLHTINLLNRPARSLTISPGELARCSLFLALNRNPSFSGITAEALDPVTTMLADVQTYLRTLIQPSTILLGHSLESDLHALQLAHPRCIDTALLFHHSRGRPLKPGLAWLTRKWLGRTIQDRGPGGHNPEEDARACIDLLKAKIKNGASPAYSSRCGAKLTRFF
jgi:DNA polymerase III epsilon subunit-like protein